MTDNRSHNRWAGVELPPGQRAVPRLPRPGAAPPTLTKDEWAITLATEDGSESRWDWAQFRALPSERITLDLHCVDGWSVLGSSWEATSVHELFTGVRASAEYALVSSYADYTANLPLEDLLEMPTWLAYAYEGRPLTLEAGGPVRLLVPHLYLWKSVKWVRRIALTRTEQPGTRERAGYHRYGDPWRQQRLQPDHPTPTHPLVRKALS